MTTDERGARVREVRDRLVREGPPWTRGPERDFETITLPERDCDRLRDLLIAERVRTVVEIGLAYGSSALAIGEALRTIGAPDARHVIVDAFQATGLNADSIDWFVPHQANKRIIDASAHKLHIAPEKVVLTVDRHGNTSAASIPLALSVARKDGRIKRGDLVLLEAMGGGFTWGAVLLRW